MFDLLHHPKTHLFSGLSLVPCGEKLLALGGYTSGEITDSVEELSETHGTWRAGPKLLQKRRVTVYILIFTHYYYFMVKVLNNSFIILFELSNCVFAFRSNFSACLYDGQLFVMGGHDGSSTTRTVEVLTVGTR